MSVGKEVICLISVPGINWGPGSVRLPSVNDVAVGTSGPRRMMTDLMVGISLRMIIGLLLWIMGWMKGCWRVVEKKAKKASYFSDESGDEDD
ncbi:hypothetical protein QN277_010480 [Acacia crassicarpa]|uniref:Transmembrane protein n=1 Tax=Acacia crassicarpa TaxID=499986 RepID=A0AAE1IMY9_9FABA|nr:hypothetical protein QN277_010480 [Acacia crassicarpa]